jgi:hypothetical protein
VKGFGVLLTALGVVIALGALFMSTSVSSPGPTSLYGGTSVSEVYNLGLLQHQLMIFVAGLAVAVSGVVVACAGTIIEHRAPNGIALGSEGPPISEEPRDPSSPSLPPSARFTAEEQAEANKRADRVMFLFLGGVAVVGIIIAAVTFA